MPVGLRFPPLAPPPTNDGYTDSFEETRRSTPMEIGTVRRRNRVRKAPRQFDLAFVFSEDDFKEFDRWWQDDIEGGAQLFDIQLIDSSDSDTPTWFTVRIIGGKYDVNVTQAYLFEVKFKVRTTLDGFTDRPSGTDALRGHGSMGVKGALGLLYVVTPYRGIAHVGLSRGPGTTGGSDGSDGSGVGTYGTLSLPPLRAKITAGLFAGRGRLTAFSFRGTTAVGLATASGRFNTLNAWTQRAASRGWRDIASSSDGSKLVAAAAFGNLYTSTDYGVNWTSRATALKWEGVASSSDGTKLVAVVENGFIFTSTDSGVNWTQRAASRVWQSVASSDDGTKLAAVEFGGNIWLSTDSGVNWASTGPTANWRGIASSSDGVKLVATVDGGNIYTSTNSGASWTSRASSRQWKRVASSSDGVKLAAVVGSGGQIYTSTDSGVNWTARYSAISNLWGIASSSDGSVLLATNYFGLLYKSTDSGVNWTSTASSKAWIGAAMSDDGSKLYACVDSGFIFSNP